MMRKLFERVACAALQKGIDWMTPDESACILLADFEQALQLKSLTPIQKDSYHPKQFQNMLELGLKFNCLSRETETNVFQFGGEAANDKPCIIRSQYTGFRTGATKIAVMIYDPAHDDDNYDRHVVKPVFGVSGIMVDDERLAINRIVLPIFHRMAFDGSMAVPNHSAVLHAALDFGGRCIHRMDSGNKLFLYSDYIDAGLKPQNKAAQLAAGGMNP